ncbi:MULTISPECIES: hypothetical protein [unclassified Enterococcus]|uniref:hypothetical protein n=1 Tax=unclassified Enterococcus TaxID=2608891 RepID=UPI0013ED292B|nr:MULTISPECIES: hypothetical protein [unclassified Enterococcus]
MKKIIWITSINTDGVYPFGYGGLAVTPLTSVHLKKIQRELKSAFEPEYELEFISYNVNSQEMPLADRVIYNERDEVYMDEEMKKHGIKMPFLLFYQGKVEEIKDFIKSNL